MNSTEIEFTIQSLDGETFPVSIERAAGEKYWRRCGNRLLRNPYSKYGLDILKEAICKITGNDPISQQLVADKPLNISTPIIPLANQLITLIIMPPFSITFKPQESSHYFHPIDANIDWFMKNSPAPSPIICYLHSAINNPPSPIEVIGIYRAHFKIKGSNIPPQYLKNKHAPLSYTSQIQFPEQYNWQLPEYVWLRYDNRIMNIPHPHDFGYNSRYNIF
jgi:hypothetical protein